MTAGSRPTLELTSVPYSHLTQKDLSHVAGGFLKKKITVNKITLNFGAFKSLLSPYSTAFKPECWCFL